MIENRFFLVIEAIFKAKEVHKGAQRVRYKSKRSAKSHAKLQAQWAQLTGGQQ